MFGKKKMESNNSHSDEQKTQEKDNPPDVLGEAETQSASAGAQPVDGGEPPFQQEEKSTEGAKDFPQGKIEISGEEYQKLKEEAAGFKERYVRLYAEFDNARKRMERERMEFVRYASQNILEEFTAVLDDLERSIEAANAKHEDYDAFLKGIEMVMAHIYEMLKKHDVKPMESVGKKFDPNYHEALMQVESDQFEDGVITEELQRGYFLGDRVLRTAKVKVAKRK